MNCAPMFFFLRLLNNTYKLYELLIEPNFTTKSNGQHWIEIPYKGDTPTWFIIVIHTLSLSFTKKSCVMKTFGNKISLALKCQKGILNVGKHKKSDFRYPYCGYALYLTQKRDMSNSFESSIGQVEAKNHAFRNRQCHTQRLPDENGELNWNVFSWKDLSTGSLGCNYFFWVRTDFSPF